MDARLGDIVEALRREAVDDHISLWEIVGDLKRSGVADAGDIRIMTVACIEEMLRSGFVAGFSLGKDFEPWPDQKIESVVARIEKEWAKLPGELNPGDIVWFDLPTSPNDTAIP